MPSQKDVEYLKLLQKSREKSKILKNCSNCMIKTICECVLNLLKGNLPISKRAKTQLTPFKKTLRTLAQKRVPLYRKRRLLIQKGDGFLSFLIPTALTVLSSLIHGT